MIQFIPDMPKDDDLVIVSGIEKCLCKYGLLRSFLIVFFFWMGRKP